MALEKREWTDSSVPTADDFNRIENNIAALDNNKEPNISVLPISKGGTGSRTIESARESFGLGYTRGPVPINCGGTGATSVAEVRSKLGLGNTTGPVPVNCGGTGKSSFSSGHFIVGNGSGALTELYPDKARVGYADKAVYDGNGNNIANTYLGTSTTVLLGPDYVIGGDGKTVNINGSFSSYKYIIFLARDVTSGSNTDYSYCMVEQKLLRDRFNNYNCPLAITRDGARLKLYRSSNSSVYVISRQFNNRLTIYGVN